MSSIEVQLIDLNTFSHILRLGVDGRLRRLVPDRMNAVHRLINFLVIEQVRLFGFKMQLLPYYLWMTKREWAEWEMFYLPMPVKDKVVLDVGAGCGETAAFYLHHGAKRVVAIESNPLTYDILCRNITSNQMPVEPILSTFDLSHLKIKHDLLKMDVEGAESLLLDYGGSLGACTIEVHEGVHPGLSNKLVQKFKLATRYPVFDSVDTFLLVNALGQ